MGGRGLCSPHDAVVMSCLLPRLVWGQGVRKRYLLPLSLVLGSVCVDSTRVADAPFEKL